MPLLCQLFFSHQFVYRVSRGMGCISKKPIVDKIGLRICEATGDNRATTFLTQRLTIDIQYGNAILVMVSIPSPAL